MTIAFVLLAIALSSYTLALGPVKLAFSSLLVCMMAGTVFCNTSAFPRTFSSAVIPGQCPSTLQSFSC